MLRRAPRRQPSAPSAATLGEALTLFDVSAVAGGPQYAAGQRAGQAALLAVGIDVEAVDDAWQAAFGEALALAQGLVPPADATPGRRGSLPPAAPRRDAPRRP